jgi:hypothetical protein
MVLRLVKKKVKKEWNYPGANLKQVKEFLDSVEGAPDDAYVTTRNWAVTDRVKWIEVDWVVG